MQIDSHIVDRYLNGDPLFTKEDDWMPIEKIPTDLNRQEVSAELKTRMLDSLARFPSFNHALFMALFPTLDHTLEKVNVHLVVSTRQLFHMAKRDQTIDLFIDLIQAANHTHIVSQMLYLILYSLHSAIAKHCLQERWTIQEDSYQKRLNHLCFIEGFATYLAWNEDAANYRFYTDRYEQKKERAFGLLYHAFQTTDTVIQEKIFTSRTAIPFWNQFWTTAPLFYIDDIYRSDSIDGVRALYEQGWSHFVETIFAME